MYCSQCGKKIAKSSTFCPECGCKVDGEIPVNNTATEAGEKQYIKGMNNDTALCILSLILMYGAPIIGFLLSIVTAIIPVLSVVVNLVIGLCPLAALALAIYTKVKYKDSKFAKILLIVYIVQMVISLIALIIMVIACVSCSDIIIGEFSQGCDSLAELGTIISSFIK